MKDKEEEEGHLSEFAKLCVQTESESTQMSFLLDLKNRVHCAAWGAENQHKTLRLKIEKFWKTDSKNCLSSLVPLNASLWYAVIQAFQLFRVQMAQNQTESEQQHRAGATLVPSVPFKRCTAALLHDSLTSLTMWQCKHTSSFVDLCLI